MKLWNPWALPSPLSAATTELEQAERSLLASASNAEYHRAMVQYNEERISRLRRTIREMTDKRKNSEILGN